MKNVSIFSHRKMFAQKIIKQNAISIIIIRSALLLFMLLSYNCCYFVQFNQNQIWIGFKLDVFNGCLKCVDLNSSQIQFGHSITIGVKKTETKMIRNTKLMVIIGMVEKKVEMKVMLL